jgi:hypothetical protein
MDYTPDAIHIAKWQWDLIHDPGVIIRAFERDADAMRIGSLSASEIKEFLKDMHRINSDTTITSGNKANISIGNHFETKSGSIYNGVQLSDELRISSVYMKLTTPEDITAFSSDMFSVNVPKTIPTHCTTCRESGYIEYIFKDLQTDFFMTVVIKKSDRWIFERYVFPVPEGTLQAKLEGEEALTREEANEIRDVYIENIQDPEKKKTAYYLLQEKVTLVDPENFKDIVAKECIDACDTILAKHYEELDKPYSRPYESWSLATQDSASIYIHKECYEKAINYLDDELGKGNPVMVGVDYKSGSGNYDKITDHWVVITARRQDAGGVYYTYMEVAQLNTDNEEVGFNQGTNTNRNRFYFDETNNYLIGIEPTVNSKGKKPIITIIRGISNDNCCKRTPYVNNQKIDKANRIDKKNADGTFIVIRENKINYN